MDPMKGTRDLTAMAKAGKLNPVIEKKDDEILSRCIQFLRRKTHNNLILIGPIIVPKTAIYECLAQRILEEDVPQELKNRKLIFLDMFQLETVYKCNEKTTGVKWTEEFVVRLKNVCNEVIAGHNILIMENYYPSIYSIDVREVLKPMLGHGKLQCIIGTQGFNFKKYMENDRAFTCQFQQVFMNQGLLSTMDPMKGTRDLTAMAKAGKLNPVIERDDKILSRCIQTLRRKNHNNLILIGHPEFVERSVIYQGLAQRIVEGDVPRELKNRKLIFLDMVELVDDAKRSEMIDWAEEFVDRLNNVCKEVIAGHNILILDNYPGSLGTYPIDVSKFLKPMIGRGKVQCILGAENLHFEYYVFFFDEAFQWQFRKVFMDHAIDEADAYTRPKAFDEIREAISRLESGKDILSNESDSETDRATLHIVRRIKEKISKLKGVESKLEEQWEDKKMILKRIQLLNEEIDKVKHEIKRAKQICFLNYTIKYKYSYKSDLEQSRLEAQLEFKQFRMSKDYREHVKNSKNDIFEGVPRRTTEIPRPMPKMGKNLQLEDMLHKRVVGQDHAVHAVAKAIQKFQAGVSNPHHPVASFMFMGPTGVGKTLLAEVLAKCLFNDKEALVQFFMGTFSQDNAIQRLIGAPLGCVGYEIGGQLTNLVLKKHRAVILFEDVEKAHPDVFNLLRQILVDGRVKDSQGKIVDFTNTVIIMTSTNVGSPYILDTNNDSLAKETAYETLRQNVMKAAREILRPELMDHIDDHIVFRPFDPCHLNEIVRLELDMVQQKLALQKISIEVTDAAVELLGSLAYSPNCSARAVKRVIRKYVESHIARRIVIKEYNSNDTILIDTEMTTDDDGLVGDNRQLIQHMKFIFKKLGSAHLKEEGVH